METKVSIPTAKAGEKLVAPALVVTSFISASVRNMKDENGEITGELIALRLADLPANVLRTPEQIKGDLSSFYTKEQLQVLTKNVHMCAHAYNESFKGKPLTFVGSYHEEGAIQTIDKNSKLYLNGITNPETNKPFAIGDKTPTKTSGIWVEGFIEAEVTAEESRNILADFFATEAKVKAGNDALAV